MAWFINLSTCLFLKKRPDELKDKSLFTEDLKKAQKKAQRSQSF
jgi:hypothetical protein